jgi:cell wall-associated NlpC family hydrolase
VSGGIEERTMSRPRARIFAWLPVLAALACASPPPPADGAGVRSRVVRTASAQLGTPYRPGGQTPSGFDCSGLVVYSYAEAGVRGLPHSAARLDAMSRRVDVEDLEPGDLLFFDLGGRKARHVGIYVGGRSFVHAPSSGGSVERVSFDHVYWGRHIRRAGRLLD